MPKNQGYIYFALERAIRSQPGRIRSPSKDAFKLSASSVDIVGKGEVSEESAGNMRILSSDIGLTASHEAVEKHVERTSMQAWVEDQPVDAEGLLAQNGNARGRGSRNIGFQGRRSQALRQFAQNPWGMTRLAGRFGNLENQSLNTLAGQMESETMAPRDIVELSREALSALSKGIDTDKAVAKLEAAANEIGAHTKEHLLALILKAILERVTGKEFKFFSPSEFGKAIMDAYGSQPGAGMQAPEPQREGWGVAIDHFESHYEYERTTFEAAGTVETADGRTIDFGAEFSLTRERLEEQSLSIRMGDAAQLSDPLVINFGGPLAALTNEKYAFDLDSDGEEEEISFVRPGNGLLALDLNGDGVVNNGGELFGPSSGDGFLELAAYDSDGNGWIDEADPVFGSLRVWTKDADGVDVLSTLVEMGVGAIYLGTAETPFSVKDGDDQLLGQLRSSGVYLEENGSAGIIQQVDLAV